MADISSWAANISIGSAKQVLSNLTFPQFNLRSLFAIPLAVNSILSSHPAGPDSYTTSSLSSWLPTENGIALQGVLNNIGANGSKVVGAHPGIVVAGPSKSDPDCRVTVNHLDEPWC